MPREQDTPTELRAVYEAFPYPDFPAAALDHRRPHPAFHFPTLHAAVTRRWRDTTGLRLLDAGCGTGETTLCYATWNPGMAITALDLSEASLARLRERLTEASITGIELERGDLLDPSVCRGPYDLVAATGVIHHLPDPARALAALTARLAPDGLLSLLAYCRHGRGLIGMTQDIIRLLAGPEATAPERVAVGRRLFRSLPSNHPLVRAEAPYQSLHKADPHFADMYANVPEHCFDLEELFVLLQGAGLAFVRLHDPAAWALETLLPDPGLQERARRLSESARWRLSDLLQPARTHYFVLARRSDWTPRRPDWSDDDLLKLCPVVSPLARAERAEPLVQTAPGETRINVRVPQGGRADVPPEMLAFLRQCDGKRPLRELASRVAPSVGKAIGPREIVALFRSLEAAGILFWRASGDQGNEKNRNRREVGPRA